MNLATLLAERIPPHMAERSAGWRAEAYNHTILGPPERTTNGLRLCAGSVTLTYPDLREQWGDVFDAETRISDLAEQLRADRPPLTLTCLPYVAAMLAGGPPAMTISIKQGWLAAVRLTEATLLALASSADRAYRDLLPLVRRTRFLLTSAPLRQPQLALPTRGVLGSPGGYSHVAEQARAEWALDLANHEEHPALLAWPPAILDRELHLLVFAGVDGAERNLPFIGGATTGTAPASPQPDAGAGAGTPSPPRSGGPLPGSGNRPPATRTRPAVTVGGEERRLRAWLVRETFLPRFMLLRSWRVLHPVVGAGPRAGLSVLMLVLLTPVVALAFPDHTVGVLRGIAGLSLLAYAAILLCTFRHREATSLFCLRLPAGAAIGVVALLSIDDTWAKAATDRWLSLLASSVLLVAGVSYLAIEAQGHGAPGGRSLAGRVGVVTLLGLAHAIGVAAVVLAYVVPAVKPDLAGIIGGQDAAPPAEILAVAATVGFAAGVLLQVVWDERPVTYPLTHMPWKGRTR